jgi:protocatechuate 3,4-dioxygenase beta subunit
MLVGRRDVLRLLAGATVLPILGCDSTASSPDLSAPDLRYPNANCPSVPGETAGPFPGDGTNGPNALTQSGVVRSDLRSSFGALSGVAEGVPLTVELTLTDASNGCAPWAGCAVYLWHCDRAGQYSLYDTIADQNYLRGVQEADASGVVRFSTIFPGAYSGRWPHLHFEVYPSLAAATSAGNRRTVSQLALPAAACNAVYATSGYEVSAGKYAMVGLQSDSVFRDGVSMQMMTASGNVAAGYLAGITVAV